MSNMILTRYSTITDCFTNFINDKIGDRLLLIIAVALMLPIILFKIAGFEINLTLALLPLAALALWFSPGALRNCFALCLITGLASIVLATIQFGDSLNLRYIYSLILVSASPLYFFLGAYLCSRLQNFDHVMLVIAVVGSLFLLVLTADVLIRGSQVRWYIGDLGYTVLNVQFLGLPIYGSFGVLSLASFFVLQMFIIGSAFLKSDRTAEAVILLLGFACAVFLVMGTNARSVQLVFPYILVVFACLAIFGTERKKTLILLAITFVSAGISANRMIEDNRIIMGARELFNISQSTPSTLPPLATQESKPVSTSISAKAPATPVIVNREVEIEKLSTGRLSLLKDAFTEFKSSPLVGIGFASYHRGNANAGETKLSESRTTHIHYMTILWKGGLLFFVPYMSLVAMFWWHAIKGAREGLTDGVAFVLSGVFFLFTVLSLTWDILLVPSAGAVGFFLLGAITHSKGINNENGALRANA